MAETYSLGVTGINANTRYTPATLKVGDTDAAGNAIGSNAVAQSGVMSRGNQVLCKNPDGSQSYYTIDPVRSIPGVSLVLLAV